MSDADLFKAIKEYEQKKLYNNASKEIELLKRKGVIKMNEEIENNSLDKVQEVKEILHKIKDTCKAHNFCKYCPYFIIDKCCIFNSTRFPEQWDL